MARSLEYMAEVVRDHKGNQTFVVWERGTDKKTTMDLISFFATAFPEGTQIKVFEPIDALTLPNLSDK